MYLQYGFYKKSLQLVRGPSFLSDFLQNPYFNPKIISTKPPTYGPTLTFMAFKLKFMAFTIKLTSNDPNWGKNYKVLKFWVLDFGFGL